MRRTVGSLLAVLMVLTVGAGRVTATGKSGTDLSVCTNEAEDYYGGVEVYAKDKGKGANRVMCPPTHVEGSCESPECDPPFAELLGARRDNNLNRRNRGRPPLSDIWNGFVKNIESFEMRAAAGCLTQVTLYVGRNKFLLDRHLVNTDGTDSITKRYEIPRRHDNKATKVEVIVWCQIAG